MSDAQTRYDAAVTQRADLEQQAADLESQAAAAVERLAPVDELAGLQSKAAALVQLVARAKTLEHAARADWLDEQIDDTRRQMNDISAIIPEETRIHDEAHQAARQAMRVADERLAAVQGQRAALYDQIQAMSAELEKLRG